MFFSGNRWEKNRKIAGKRPWKPAMARGKFGYDGSAAKYANLVWYLPY
jgi:hypothetical protein